LELNKQRVGLSGTEKMFWEEVDQIGATVEAYIQRPARDWMEPLYVYKVTLPDGRIFSDYIRWGVDTFSNVLDSIKDRL
jgi:hypothetical protein